MIILHSFLLAFVVLVSIILVNHCSLRNGCAPERSPLSRY